MFVKAGMKQTMGRIYRFYADGFKSMTTGRMLWLLIVVKLVVMFCILRAFFFPNFLSSVAHSDEEKGDYVGRELIERNH